MYSKLITLLIFTLSFSANSQSNKEEIKNYENIKKTFQSKIISLNDSISKLDLKISKLKLSEIQETILDSSFIAVTLPGTKLKKFPNTMSDILKTFPDSEKAIIFDYKDSFFNVRIGYDYGFISEIWIKSTDEIKNYIQNKELLEKETKRINEEKNNLKEKKESAQIKKNEEKRQIALKNKYIKKYGIAIYKKLMTGRFWIGMTPEMARISLGNPTDINKSVGSWGIHEQWVYSNTYLYFENGKLTSYQN